MTAGARRLAPSATGVIIGAHRSGPHATFPNSQLPFLGLALLAGRRVSGQRDSNPIEKC